MATAVKCKDENKKLLSQLYGSKGLGDAYINFHIALSNTRQKYQKIHQTLHQPTHLVFPGKKKIKTAFENGRPIIAFTPVYLSPVNLIPNFKDILAIFETHGVCTGEASQWAQNQSAQNKTDAQLIQNITRAVISFDHEAIQALSRSTPLPPPTLLLAGRELVKPFFHSLAHRAARDIAFDHWQGGHCPICGDSPDFARFSKEEEGKRRLWCSKCNLEWTFQRLSCPFCQNHDQQSLRFMTTNYRQELRIDVCEQCKGYIKTMDERKTETPAIPAREHTATLFLDLMALEKDYIKPYPGFMETRVTLKEPVQGKDGKENMMF